MLRWLRSRVATQGAPAHAIPDALWLATLDRLPFLRDAGAAALPALRRLTEQFLASKQFHGAGGLEISDEMALLIAAQACLPVLHLRRPLRGIDWYDDFVGIVVYPGAVRARRQTTDDAGIVHQWDEVLSGEAMQDGPVMLSWQDVAEAGAAAEDGCNLVVHEFVHKIDMRDGSADGCPPLGAGFMGAARSRDARRIWNSTLQQHYQDFCDQLSLADRFGAPMPWLDRYGSTAIDEFFAVSSEAYFVNRRRFGADFPGLLPMFDAFFRPQADGPRRSARDRETAGRR